MKIENFTAKLTIIDFINKTSFERSYEGDAPDVQQFANFCYEAGRAYGFSEKMLNKVIQYSYE